jgi:hypothetical protein
MGSFPNKVASQILRSLFIDKDVAAAPALYTGTTTNTKGILTEAANGTSGGTPLYIGLISGGTSSNAIPNGTGSLSNFLNDAAIVSSGVAVAGWPVAAGTRQLKEFTGANNNTLRQVIQFSMTSGTADDGASIVTITGPTAPIQFAGTGGVTAAQATHESIIGFFITTLGSAAGLASSTGLPTVLAYGTLSMSRSVALGDNPTFAANSITITLD